MEEGYNFFVDVETYAYNNKAYSDMFLLFQVYTEKHPMEESDDDDDTLLDETEMKLIVNEAG